MKDEPGINTPTPADASSLDSRFATGLAWTAGSKWATQLLTWGSLLAVAHLLTPADYGIGNMAGSLTIVANVMAEFGVGTAVLHMPELSRKALAQLHVFSCLVSCSVFLIATLLAPLVARFYHAPLLIFIVNNSILLITGLQAVPMALLARDMDYRRLSFVEAATMITQSSVTIVGAFLGWGYWALFAGNAAGRVVAAVMAWSWKHVGFAWPRWHDIHYAVRLGGQTAIGRVAWSFYSQADGVVVGRILGASVLGNYQIAMSLASAPADKVSSLLMRTATPLFANIFTEHGLVRRYYTILTEILSMAVMPLMVGLSLVAPLAVPVVFGSKWVAAIGAVQWLSLYMVMRTLSTLAEQVLISQRRTRFTMRMSIFNLIFMPIAFVIAAKWRGSVGVAGAWIVVSPITVLPILIMLQRTIHLPLRKYIASLLPAIAGTLAMTVALLAFREWLQPASWSVRTMLIAQIAVGAAAYGTVLIVFFRERLQRYVRFLKERTQRANRSEELSPEAPVTGA